MSYISYNKKIFDVFKVFTLGYTGIAFLVIWAFFESSIWFIIPDFILLMFVLVNPKRFVKLFFIVFISSAIGMLTYMAFVYFNTQMAYEILLRVPLVSISMLEKVGLMYETQGSIILLWQPFSGIPGKVWTFMAVESGFNLWVYILLITMGRGIRIFLVSYIVSKVGIYFSGTIRNNFGIFILIYLSIFTSFLYLLYF